MTRQIKNQMGFNGSYKDSGGKLHFVYGDLYAKIRKEPTPPTQVHRDKSKYSRKEKHKRNWIDE